MVKNNEKQQTKKIKVKKLVPSFWRPLAIGFGLGLSALLALVGVSTCKATQNQADAPKALEKVKRVSAPVSDGWELTDIKQFYSNGVLSSFAGNSAVRKQEIYYDNANSFYFTFSDNYRFEFVTFRHQEQRTADFSEFDKEALTLARAPLFRFDVVSIAPTSENQKERIYIYVNNVPYEYTDELGIKRIKSPFMWNNCDVYVWNYENPQISEVFTFYDKKQNKWDLGTSAPVLSLFGLNKEAEQDWAEWSSGGIPLLFWEWDLGYSVSRPEVGRPGLFFGGGGLPSKWLADAPFSIGYWSGKSIEGATEDAYKKGYSSGFSDGVASVPPSSGSLASPFALLSFAFKGVGDLFSIELAGIPMWSLIMVPFTITMILAVIGIFKHS